ncbi:MAG: hypothetical protein IPH57_01740 [Saprospiraceae bacterium]|nr:hypothetical protein [Saprospiraceae bacterium]
MESYDNIFDFDEDGLLELKRKFPFSCVPDLAINEKAYQANGNISVVKMLELINKTNNSGLALASIVSLINENRKQEVVELLKYLKFRVMKLMKITLQSI